MFEWCAVVVACLFCLVLGVFLGRRVWLPAVYRATCNSLNFQREYASRVDIDLINTQAQLADAQARIAVMTAANSQRVAATQAGGHLTSVVLPEALATTHTRAPYTPWATLNGQRLNLVALETRTTATSPHQEITLTGYMPLDDFQPISIFGTQAVRVTTQTMPMPTDSPEPKYPDRNLRGIRIRDSATREDAV